MKIYEVVNAFTDDKNPVTIVSDLIGKKKPYAYFMNYGCHGYAHFKIDERSLKAYENKLSLIEDSLTRKLIYSDLYEMMKEGDISGYYLLRLLKKHLPDETSEDVI